MSSPASLQFDRRLQQFTAMAAGCAILIGGTALVAWATGTVRLLNFRSVWPVMVPNTAISIVALGLGLFVLHRPERGMALRLVARAPARSPPAFGLVSLSEYVFATDAGLDHWFFSEHVAQIQKSLPGRPSIPTSANLVMVGVSLLLLDFRSRRGRKPAEVLAISAMLV